MIVTTSWDDGYKSDLRIAELLTKYGAKGTFYICPSQQHSQFMLEAEDRKKLSQQHEIGAHTITHPKLSKIPLKDAQKEIAESKRWIEQQTGKPCTQFCYPYGDYNSAVRKAVQEAGFAGARTVEKLQFNGKDKYVMPTSVQVYPFPFRRRFTRWWHVLDPIGPLRTQWMQLRSLEISPWSCRSWLAYATALFDHAVKNDHAFFHVWGHAHELDRYDMWSDLERLLAYMSRHQVRFGTNSDVVSLLSHS